MASEDDDLVRRREAGRWLRATRERRGFPTGDALAQRLGVTPGVISRYETGASKVSDERARQLADALGLDIITVRRNLGLWVNPDAESAPAAGETTDPFDNLPDDPEERRRVLTEMLDARARETAQIAEELNRLSRETG
jgi:transcriptional regulator with XRE-family HTH domain